MGSWQTKTFKKNKTAAKKSSVKPVIQPALQPWAQHATFTRTKRQRLQKHPHIHILNTNHFTHRPTYTSFHTHLPQAMSATLKVNWIRWHANFYSVQISVFLEQMVGSIWEPHRESYAPWTTRLPVQWQDAVKHEARATIYPQDRNSEGGSRPPTGTCHCDNWLFKPLASSSKWLCHRDHTAGRQICFDMLAAAL